MRRLDWRTLGVGLFVIGLLLIPAWPGRTTGQTHDSRANEGAEGSGTGVGAGWQDRSLVSSEPKTIAQTCLLNCQVTVPTVASPQAEILFQSMVEATGCLGTPTFSWSFGDGSPDKTEQNPRHTYASPGQYQWKLTTHVESGSRTIETIVGGLGEGTNARQATLQEVLQLARDPLGRGVYFVDASTEFSVLRFINTTSEPVTLAGVTIEPQAVRLLAGGGLSISDNIDARQADLALASGLAVSPGGDLVYLINALDGLLRVINVSASPVTVQSNALSPGQIRTLVSGLRQGINGLAVHPTSGLVHYADASPGINRVFRVEPNGTTVPVVGNGQATAVTEGFIPGQATSLPLLLPRALRFDPAGNLFVADTGHGRVIRVDTAGSATLVHQFPVGSQIINAYPSGVAFQGGSVYSANGNQQTITRLAPSAGATIIAGQPGAACDYTGSTCGDGRAMGQAGLYLFNSASSVPLASLDADATGLYLADQGPTLRARIRYLNLSGTSVTLAGVTIPAGAIETIAGNGLAYPFDGGLARSAALSTPVGVSVDPEGNLWIADTLQSLLRFVNRGPEPKTIFPGTSSEQVVPAGVIVTVNPLQTGGQINGPIVQAGFVEPQGLFSTSQGLYLVDSRGGVAVPPGSLSARRTSTLRFLNTGSSVVTFYPGSASPIEVPPGQISRIAGGGDGGKGDGGFALNAVLIGASDVVVAPNGTIYVTDVGQGSVRRIEPATGVISSLALPVAQYTGLGLDTGGRLYIANYEGSNVLRETAVESGTFAPLVGGLIRPRDVAVGSDGTAYVTVSPPTRTSGNHQVVAVSSAGVVTRVAGEQPGFRGDGGDATTAQIRIVPSDLVVGSGTSNQLPKTVNITFGVAGELVFTDSNNQRIRQLLPATLVCERTGTIEVTTQNPVPTVSALSPATAAQNSGALTLTVTGTNFVSGAVVRWNGQDRVTTYQGPTELRAQLLATDLATAGVVPVTVFHPAPGGGVSAALNFTVTAGSLSPVPVVSAITPTTAVQNGDPFTLTVIGSQFVAGAVVRWNGQDRPTTFLNSTVLQAAISSTDLAVVGTASVTVFHPAPGGGTSAALSFQVLPPNPIPQITLLNPSSTPQGSPGLTLTVGGGGFVNGSEVRWGGQPRPTIFLSNNQLTVTIPASDFAVAGNVSVTVFNPSPGGGISNTLRFTVEPIAPTLTTLDRVRVGVGGEAFSLLLTGAGFNSTTIAYVDSQARETTYVGPTELRVQILP
ncbi:MAG: IPT/TIG domain-containing protein, partial [Blastocatellia bacterium]